MVHFQTNFEKNTLPPPPAAPSGRGGGIFQNMFENGPDLAHPIFEIAMWLVFENFTPFIIIVFA